jgi:hypothetical protein
MQCARYLTGEQIEAAAKTAGIDATICEISNDAESANRELVENWKFVAAKWRSASEQKTPGVVTISVEELKRLRKIEALAREIDENAVNPTSLATHDHHLLVSWSLIDDLRDMLVVGGAADSEIARREGVST